MAKRLVVCADGTWNVPDSKDGTSICPSNVVKMALAVAPSGNGREQQIFYLKGVGTGVLDHLLGGAFGWGLSRNVLDAYRFLAEQYESDDDIFLFGFSRGAYTARSVAGLIRNCGLLKREHLDQLSAAYTLYRRRDDASHPTAVESQVFRKAFAYEARIKFIGVWDTVGALGIPVGIPWLPVSWLHFINQRWEFHDVKLSSYVGNAYQAVAIDERRPQFMPTLWEQQPHAQGQTMEQVWFAGVHSNVVVGYTDSGLSDIAFLWLKDRAEGCGLVFDQEYIRSTFKPDALGVLRDSRTGIFQLFPGAWRKIDDKAGHESNTNEAVYRSAVDRTERAAPPGYRPPNLLSYLKRPDRTIVDEPL
ncbi:MAG: DUF2235 domain-containing protein [Chloroflexi bacterium]|nr:DUF2235 domain-containing protein [Chloroflexota bacterium]